MTEPSEAALCKAKELLFANMGELPEVALAHHFDAEDIYSNCNNDGAVDFFDFLCFINKWHGGCQ